ncbi:MAG: hypothetical protein JW864_03425 [Spirochaetes bacterium]|nr:hypothetical protein [Spirochaetota bacterium]
MSQSNARFPETIVFKACGYTSSMREPEENEGYFFDEPDDSNALLE